MQFRFFRNAIIVGRENSFFIQEQRELDIGIRNCSISRFQILFFRGKYKSNRITISYIQFCYHLFPTKIFKEDREEYILSLRQCQDEETNQPFLSFMAGQLKKSLSLEIERFKVSQKKVFSFMF